jgi:hypothetical protein
LPLNPILIETALGALAGRPSSACPSESILDPGYDRSVSLGRLTLPVERSRRASEAAVVGVYRRRNAHLVLAIVDPVRAAGWTTAWWALDEVDDRLADITVGAGPGVRLPLLNEIVSRAAAEPGWLVVSDDDVVFARRNIVELVALCADADLDLAQPARCDDNSRHEYNVAHPITRARRLSRARTTTFVECGPLFVVGPRWRDRIVPFPEERGMGWGIELDWNELHGQGCRLGIVDGVRIEHRGEPGAEYDFGLHVTRVHAELEARGLRGWADVQHTLEVWKPWRRLPPWSTASGPSGG